MRKILTVLAALLMLAILAQFYLAADGAFDAAPIDESFRAHRVLGSAIIGVAILTTLVAAFLRAPGQVVGMAGLAAGLAVLQMGIATVATAVGDGTTAGSLVFGLHGVNGLAIMGVAGTLLRRVRALASPLSGAAGETSEAAGARPGATRTS